MKTPRLISFKLAQKIIIREKKKLFQESKIKLKEAHNTVASRTITSPINLPLQNTAGLDGYIVSNKNLNKVSISNKLLNAGHSYKRLNPNLAYKINTGGIIPQNFKNFISLENAKVEGKNLLVQYSKISNKDIKKKGEDLKKNKIYLLLQANNSSFKREEKLSLPIYQKIKINCFTKEELGIAFGRQYIANIGFLKSSFINSIISDSYRLQSLRN